MERDELSSDISEAAVAGEGVRRIEEILGMNPRAMDAKYKSCPSFADWSKTVVDTARWDDHVKALSEWSRLPQSCCERHAPAPSIIYPHRNCWFLYHENFGGGAR